MKKIIASLFLLFLANSFYGQNKGITYQAVIYSPDAIVLPGQDNMLAPLTNQEVCMRFSFLDKGLTSEYEETLTVITDGFGMVNLTLGQAAQSGGYASGFEQMTWEGSSKNLMVELDVSGNCFEFVEISNTTLSYVPFAMYAKTSGSSQINATNIDKNTAAIQANTTAIALNTSKVGITAQQIIEITNNTAKTGITSEQATAIAANTAKTGITAEQSDAIAVNTVKVGYTDELVSANTDVVANTAKTGITAEQSDAIAVNTVKVGYTDELVSANTDVVANTAKTGITAEQSDAIAVNTVKVGYTDELVSANTDVVANTAKTGITAEQSDAIAVNTVKVGYTDELVSVNTDVVANTAKTGITAEQSDAIAVNTVKVGYTDELVSANTDVVANTAKTGITAEQSDAIAVNTVKVGYTDELVSANTDVVANTAKTGITAEQSVAITANTAKVGMPTATEAGQMNYWNGSAWITIASTVNEGATLQMIGGVPTWVGGAPPPPLQIGDYYQGGIIFYLDGAGGGLIVAVADISPARWGCVGYGNAGTSTDVGTGATNTTAIINYCPINGIAAQLCDAYSVTVNGVTYSDWFLPSSGELNLMSQNKATINTSALENGGSSFQISSTWTEDGITYEYGMYWSSSQYLTYGAYIVDLFDNGSRWLTNQSTTRNVRAVRAF